MNKTITYALCLIILLALNIIFPKIRSSAPNFIFLLVVVYAFQQDSNDFFWLAFFGGIFVDTFSSTIFGTYTISFLLIAVIINYTTSTFLVADPHVGYMVVVILVANLFLFGLVYMINSLVLKIGGVSAALPTIYLQQKIWLDIFLNLIFVWPIYLVSQLNQKIIARYQLGRQRL